MNNHRRSFLYINISGMRQSNFLAIVMLVLAAVVCGAGQVHAQVTGEIYQPIPDSSSGISSAGGMMLGQKFNTLSSPVTFNSLGFIDLNANVDPSANYNSWLALGPDGLVGSYEVGIWNATTQQLLASTWVGPNSTLIGDFRYSAIAPTTLAANTSFIIAALLPANPQDQWLTNGHLSDSPDFSFGMQTFYLTGNTFSFPTTGASTDVSLVNASTTVVAVPEPTTTVYIVLALGCLVLLRFRRQA